ncbi:MAG TPA: sigma factor [Actinomycetota bacterium]|nr:sigma factor [Actinomycetota bacterium]
MVAAVALTSGSRPAAEDAVQEALLRAWERSEKGEEIDSLQAWVTTVTQTLGIDENEEANDRGPG